MTVVTWTDTELTSDSCFDRSQL